MDIKKYLKSINDPLQLISFISKKRKDEYKKADKPEFEQFKNMYIFTTTVSNLENSKVLKVINDFEITETYKDDQDVINVVIDIDERSLLKLKKSITFGFAIGPIK